MISNQQSVEIRRNNQWIFENLWKEFDNDFDFIIWNLCNKKISFSDL